MWTLDHIRGNKLGSPLRDFRALNPGSEREAAIAEYRKGFTINAVQISLIGQEAGALTVPSIRQRINAGRVKIFEQSGICRISHAHKVRFEPVGVEMEVEEGETVLNAAFRQGIALMHGCKEGQCGSCKSVLIRGEIELLKYSTFAFQITSVRPSIFYCAEPWPTATS